MPIDSSRTPLPTLPRRQSFRPRSAHLAVLHGFHVGDVSFRLTVFHRCIDAHHQRPAARALECGNLSQHLDPVASLDNRHRRKPSQVSPRLHAQPRSLRFCQHAAHDIDLVRRESNCALNALTRALCSAESCIPFAALCAKSHVSSDARISLVRESSDRSSRACALSRSPLVAAALMHVPGRKRWRR